MCLEYFLHPYSVPLIHMCATVPVPSCLYCCSFSIYLKIQHCDAFCSVFLAQDCFQYCESLLVPYVFLDHFLQFCGKCCWYSDWGYIKTVAVVELWSFDNTASAQRGTGNIFPFSDDVFNLIFRALQFSFQKIFILLAKLICK